MDGIKPAKGKFLVINVIYKELEVPRGHQFFFHVERVNMLKTRKAFQQD